MTSLKYVAQFMALVGPICVAIVMSLVLGWPVHMPSPAFLPIGLVWLCSTVSLGCKGNTFLSDLPPVIAKRIFQGACGGILVFFLAFCLPRISEECGIVYYHYPVAAVNVWVERLAEKIDDSGCGG